MRQAIAAIGSDLDINDGILPMPLHRLHLHLLEHGFSYARRGFVALSLPLEAPDIDGFAAAVEAFLTEHAALVRESAPAA